MTLDTEIVEDLRKAEHLKHDFLVRVLSSLVQTRSVNPGIYEEAMAKRVATWLEGTPAEVNFVESLPGRHSVGAVLDSGQPGPAIVLNGHMDTVPIDDDGLWEDDPFGATVRDGYLYGRGACDMKGGLTVQIAVAHHLAQQLERMVGKLVLHFAIGEECAEPGTLSLLQAGFVGDVGIVTEPTELKVATAERGLVFLRVRIKGRSIHASKAHLGLNPNWRLRQVLDVIEAYEQEIGKRMHPLLPAGSCTPTVIRAGVKENAVPDSCEIWFDRRMIPGETVEVEVADLGARLERLKVADPDFDFDLDHAEYFFAPAEVSPDSELASRFLEAHRQVTGRDTVIYGTPYSSDVRNLVNDAGMEAITFGAGNVAECHCSNERISLEQLRDAALVTAKVATEFLT